MKNMTVLLLTFVLCSISTFAVDLVIDGKPAAEIVISEKATPSIKTSAVELQKRLEKISGAKLNIVNAVSDGVKNQIYIGESDLTKNLGLDLSDVKHDGYKIIAKKNYLILAGKDSYHYTKLLERFPGHRPTKQIWEKESGSRWRQPSFHDRRDYSKDCEFDLHDGTGSLYAVFGFLEILGMRWFLPSEELGFVYPELKNITVKDQNIKKEPEFSQRIFTDGGFGAFRNEFLWMKSMGVGSSFVMPIYHSMGRLLDAYPEEQPKEYFGTVNGKHLESVPNLRNERYRKDFIRYLEMADKFFPNIDYACIGQPDGWSLLNDADAAAGWDKFESRGRKGRFSAYLWDFVLDIRKRYLKKYPDKKFTVFAYSNTQRPPANLDKVPEDTSIVLCQTAMDWVLPATREQIKIRKEWLGKLKHENQLLIWEYYLRHTSRYNFPPLPIGFYKQMRESFDGLYGRASGFLVEAGWTTGKKRLVTRIPKIGISHFNLYLHSKLCWDRNIKIEDVLDDYCRNFFGPAAKEMKKFYKFSEEVWNRPEPREITMARGFLKRKDVKKFFDILTAAKKKTGDSVYGKRIALIAGEMEPLKKLHDKLERTGPMVRAYYGPSKPVIDGDLSKSFWTGNKVGKRTTFLDVRDTFFPLRDMITGKLPRHIETKASFRWMPDNSALIVGIECFEPNMDRLAESCKDRDSMAIFGDDNIEVILETASGVAPKIVINSTGKVYDYCMTKNVADLPQWYTVDEVAVKKFEDRWTVEVKIIASKIDGKKPSKTFPWGVNICRQRMAGNTPEFYMLSPSGTNFKDKKCMGNLYLRK
ncbi:MAG: DUF4838 domain-containing protein [Planctomycetota bacterium]|jgi:hypothetical protein